MFKWACFILAVLVVLGLGWMLNDLRIEVKQTSLMLNEHLEDILVNVRNSTATLAALSDDLKQLRDLAGVSGLKETLSTAEWVVDARKEALWMTFRAKSQNELLERLCENKFGSSWFILFEGEKPISLLAWLQQQHPQSRENVQRK